MNPSQSVFFSRLGVAPDQKRHVSLTGGQIVIQQRSQVITKCSIGWIVTSVLSKSSATARGPEARSLKPEA